MCVVSIILFVIIELSTYLKISILCYSNFTTTGNMFIQKKIGNPDNMYIK